MDDDGSDLVYATFIGGSDSDSGNRILVDTAGAAYIIGDSNSADFPTTPGAFNRSPPEWNEPYLMKLDANGSSINFSTRVGNASIRDLYLDDYGCVYLTGYTHIASFPTTQGVYDTTFNGDHDVVLLKFNQNASALLYSTFIGGSDRDWGRSIFVDGSGNAYLTGRTQSVDFPTTDQAFDDTKGNFNDVFVLKMNDTGGSLVFSTFIGGKYQDSGDCIDVDGNGDIYVVGTTNSPDFPSTRGAYDVSLNGPLNNDLFLLKMDSTASQLTYSTFLGGTDDDWLSGFSLVGKDKILCGGSTRSSDFPTTSGVYDPTYNGLDDCFVFKLEMEILPVNPPTVPQNLSILPMDQVLSISWDPPHSDGNETILGYRVYRGPSEDNLTFHFERLGLNRNVMDFNLVNGRTYHYSVSAFNWQFEGPRSRTINGTPFAPPSSPLNLT
ncbi:MAG: SBBP repeat-containing protein, partial [Thermoplasmata archaeon]|nr:SBBP repeat-containing protein [Thermoplasmata archaeon]